MIGPINFLILVCQHLQPLEDVYCELRNNIALKNGYFLILSYIDFTALISR